MPTCCEDEEEWEHGSQPHRFHVRGHQYQYPVRTRLGHIESEGPPNGSRFSCGRDGAWHAVWLSVSSTAPWRTNETLVRRPQLQALVRRRVALQRGLRLPRSGRAVLS